MTIRLYKLICLKDPEFPEETYFVDEVGDRELYCPGCHEEHNHIYNFDRDTHKIINMGDISHEDLAEILKQRGCKERNVKLVRQRRKG